MTTFVLVHGAWHGGWCWEKLVPLLEARGHRAVAPDLPGHGADRTPTAQVTLESCAERVRAAIAAQPEPVVLVGHSMGGVVITAAAELIPERVRTLVYLTAFLVAPGEALLAAAGNDPETALAGNLVFAPDGVSAEVKPDAIRPAFYAQCSDADAERAQARLVPQAAAVFSTPVRYTPERAGRIPRVYIECTRDRAIGISVQRRMHAARPCAKVLSLDTDHSPFYSTPEALAAQLASL
jgi:pimeloyl-ACP methyl ester carboxylesterase